MSNPHHPQGPPRQPLGYPGPPAYPPQVMNPGQYSYVSASPPGGVYRSTAAGNPNPALALPSMRSIEHSLQPHPGQQQQHQHQQQQQPQQAPPPQPTVPMPAHLGPGAGGPMYYSMPYAMPTGIPQYTLPLSDPRVALSGGRHKKEIKRRTKTGCLTCRKRRIKCDETHPTCNNCKKSKRECAGYDPIFKQQPPGPSTIQPAPTTQPVASSPGPPAVSAPPVPSPVSLGSFGNNPPPAAVVPSSHPASGQSGLGFVQSSGPSASPGLGTKGDPFDYAPIIDPALESTLGTARLTSHGRLRTDLRVKKMKVDELIALGASPPVPSAASRSRETLDELTKIYHEVYMPGLAAFFETAWYNFKAQQGGQAPASLLQKPAVVDLFASFLASLASIKSPDSPEMAAVSFLETRLVWALACLALDTPPATNPPSAELIAANDATEARNRLEVFQALLSGERLTSNPCYPAPGKGDGHRIRELEFWWWLAEYLTMDDAPGQRDHALTRMRNLLDGRENRDVLYSLTILRELSPRFPPGFELTLPQHHDEADPRSKLAVAARFIRSEAHTTGGTTNVVRRFAELASKAFIHPGFNIARRA